MAYRFGSSVSQLHIIVEGVGGKLCRNLGLGAERVTGVLCPLECTLTAALGPPHKPHLQKVSPAPNKHRLDDEA